MGKGYIVIHNKQVQDIQLIIVSMCFKLQGSYISSIISYIHKYWENELKPVDAWFIGVGGSGTFTNDTKFYQFVNSYLSRTQHAGKGSFGMNKSTALGCPYTVFQMSWDVYTSNQQY